MLEPYKLSIVNYYNTTPFLYGLKHCPINWPYKLELDIPSICAQKLKDNTVDIGLVPVAVLNKLTTYHIITDYCIGAIGKVDSVKLYAHKPIEELTDVLLDYQSNTSVALVQILNKNYWKKNIRFINTTQGFENTINGTTGGVIIGDRTFGLNQYPYQYDLAEEWFKFTGLPFVFACWVSTKKIEEKFISLFNNALQHGVENIYNAVIENPKKINGFDDYDYLQNKISYTLDDPKKQALNLFLGFMKELV